MINILTDSTADLTKEQCEKYHIDTIPMYVQLNGKMYRDGEDIDASMLFNRVKDTGKYPTTSAPSPGDFFKFFNRKGKSIYISVSSMLSSTFQNAQLALKGMRDRNNVDIIDSLSISTGYGQVVLKAAEWRNAGMEFEELTHCIRHFIKQTRGIFILNTVDYLYHGGRCSTIEHFVSSLLKIRPLLNVRPDGTLGVLQKVRGSRIKAVESLLNFFKTELESSTIGHITITHLECDDEASFLTENIKSINNEVQISTAKVGCVLATHSGPKPLGIAYSVE
jgi:DegV family protein with EDD domain